MSLGSYASSSGEAGLGNTCVGFNPWVKYGFGWAVPGEDLEIVSLGETRTFSLVASTEYPRSHTRFVYVALPPKEVVTEFIPLAGAFSYYSEEGDNLSNRMFRTVTVGAAATLTAKVSYRIEEDWDYAYVTVDAGAGLVFMSTSLSTETNPNAGNLGFGITGYSNGVVDLSVDLSTFSGQTVEVSIWYITDAFVQEQGIFVDEIQIGDGPVEGAEDPATYWDFSGFVVVGTERVTEFPQGYFLEYRAYKNFDAALEFSGFDFNAFRNEGLRTISKFPYQDGLLVWYWDTSFTNNNVKQHCDEGRCGGMILPIDSHPQIIRREGVPLSASVVVYDAPFSLEDTDVVCLDDFCFGGLPAEREFSDVGDPFFVEEWPYQGVSIEEHGVKARIINKAAGGNWLTIRVTGAQY